MAEVTLYNAGDRIKESIKFTKKNSKEDFKQFNWLAYWQIDAPAEAFFSLPDEIKIEASPLAPASRLPVSFAEDMAKKHGHKGVVAVIPERATPVDDNEPYAATKEEAKEKAERLWREHLVKTVEDHIAMCAMQRAAGAAPHAASHFTARAFKLTRMVDPGQLLFETRQSETDKLREKSDKDDKEKASAEMAEIRQQLAEVLRQNSKLQKKLEAEDKARKEAAEQERILAKQQA